MNDLLSTSPRAVMGIDAAWTLTEPSGVALAREAPNGWELVVVETSYEGFLARANITSQTDNGSAPNVPSLLAAAYMLSGCNVELVAIDIPLARSPIIGRRHSDNEVSRAYGSRKCGTHTPSVSRPGPLSEVLREGFERAGYPLVTSGIARRGVIEVYPHPALVELAGAAERLPYKASKIRSYWPTLSPAERRRNLFAQWRRIVLLLESQIAGVEAALPDASLNEANGRQLKAYEDALDAVVCAWVGVCLLEGVAAPFGDDHSAIWIPVGSSCPHN